MYKSQLYEAVADETDIDIVLVKEIVDCLLQRIMMEVSGGERIVLTGFGTLSRKMRRAKRGRHPGTGKPLLIPARWAVSFRVGKIFKDKVRS